VDYRTAAEIAEMRKTQPADPAAEGAAPSPAAGPAPQGNAAPHP
jgi:hypothetical protein